MRTYTFKVKMTYDKEVDIEAKNQKEAGKILADRLGSNDIDVDEGPEFNWELVKK